MSVYIFICTRSRFALELRSALHDCVAGLQHVLLQAGVKARCMLLEPLRGILEPGTQKLSPACSVH